MLFESTPDLIAAVLSATLGIRTSAAVFSATLVIAAVISAKPRLIFACRGITRIN